MENQVPEPPPRRINIVEVMFDLLIPLTDLYSHIKASWDSFCFDTGPHESSAVQDHRYFIPNHLEFGQPPYTFL